MKANRGNVVLIMNPGAYHRRDLGWRARAGSVHPEKGRDEDADPRPVRKAISQQDQDLKEPCIPFSDGQGCKGTTRPVIGGIH
jgi:hypothetical protein